MKQLHIRNLLFLSILMVTPLFAREFYQPYEPFNPFITSKNERSFIVDENLGGHEAQGTYHHKNHTATIIRGDTTYYFHKIKLKRNPELSHNPDNLIKLGSYSIISSHGEKQQAMPLTFYLFGLESEAPQKNSETQNTVIFQPANTFDKGLIGKYLINKRTATIQDPSNNSRQYSFENVVPGGIETPEGLTLIGAYFPAKHCHGNICSHAMIKINLYGTLVENSNE